jgi:hypothetical protein
VTEIFRFKQDGSGEIERVWSEFVDAVSTTQSAVSALSGISVNLENEMFAGVIGWESLEVRFQDNLCYSCVPLTLPGPWERAETSQSRWSEGKAGRLPRFDFFHGQVFAIKLRKSSVNCIFEVEISINEQNFHFSRWMQLRKSIICALKWPDMPHFHSMFCTMYTIPLCKVGSSASYCHSRCTASCCITNSCNWPYCYVP